MEQLSLYMWGPEIELRLTQRLIVKLIGKYLYSLSHLPGSCVNFSVPGMSYIPLGLSLGESCIVEAE